MKYLFTFLLLFHGWIHLIGFAKSINLAASIKLKKKVSIPFGVLWLITGLLFVYLSLSFLVREDWYMTGFVTVVLSQLLILFFWKDTKAASIINLLVFSVALVHYSGDEFEKKYRSDVSENLKMATVNEELVEDEDLEHLPKSVANYLRYVGVVGRPKIENVKITMHGEMREREGAWFQFQSFQHNFFSDPARFFFMKAKVTRLPAYGYHSYHAGDAQMQVKMMGLFSVVDLKGDMLYEAETVTFLNDLCIFAPAALINENILWTALNDTVVEATIVLSETSVSARLYFNKQGQLTNFVSEDRYEISDMKKYRFSTPISSYKNINGYNLPSYGEAIWHYPDEKFTYGKFDILDITYNLTLEEAL